MLNIARDVLIFCLLRFGFNWMVSIFLASLPGTLLAQFAWIEGPC